MLLFALALPGCTLVKPIVGAITGPFLALEGGGYCGNGEGAVVVLAGLSIFGALGGLVTGIISDVQALTGAAPDPAVNWWHPFRTNTDPTDH